MNNERTTLVDQAGGGDAGDRPTLVGEYTFSNLKTNVGQTDEDFSETNPHYFFARRTTPLARQEMVAYYHKSRPHQAKDNDLLVLAGGVEKAEEPGVVRLSDIRCKKRLGGVLKHYYRKAA